MPLFAPGVILKSASNSKSEYRFRVMMSPPLVDSSPLSSRIVSTPSLMTQPRAGKLSERALRQPSVVLPSHNKRQPAFTSSVVNEFGLAGGLPGSFLFGLRLSAASELVAM